MLGFYNYTVYLTYISLISSVVGMFLAFAGNVRAALLCLLISGCCDMFDGKIARTKKDRTEDEKRFGIQIDSLCDVICFGCLPAAISYGVGATAWWQVGIAAFFVLCGVIRLGYFNVLEETRMQKETSNRKSYLGLPITASAIFVPLLMCFTKLMGEATPYAFTVLLFALAICYVLPIDVKKPGLWGGIVMLAAGAVIFALILILN